MTHLIGFPVFALVAIALALESAAQDQFDSSVAAAPKCSNMVVLSYESFGPQVAANAVIGFQWYQWLDCPCGDIEGQKIKVVIYKDLSLKKVKKKYPVIKAKSDYRYLAYQKALSFLDEQISYCTNEVKSGLAGSDSSSADMFNGLAEKYQETKSNILRGICPN